jgi:hypothetical protein
MDARRLTHFMTRSPELLGGSGTATSIFEDTASNARVYFRLEA